MRNSGDVVKEKFAKGRFFNKEQFISAVCCLVFLLLFISIPDPAKATDENAAFSVLTAYGPITEDTTWSGTVHVTGDVTVEENVTLTVVPGTVVKFFGYRSLGGLGSLQANGATFTSANSSPEPTHWYYMSIAAGSSSSVENCEVSYARKGIVNHSGSSTITGCRFHHNKEGLIYVLSGAQGPINITGNTFEDNTEAAISLILSDYAGEINVDGNTATGNGYNGIVFDSGSSGSRTIGGNCTLNGQADFPFIIAHGLEIKDGGFLTINPGTVIKGVGNSIEVYGGLAAEGVYFTSVTNDAVGGDTNNDGDATSPDARDWRGGINFFEESTGLLEGCDLSYMGEPDHALDLYGNSNVTITECTLHHICRPIHSFSTSILTVTYCEFSDYWGSSVFFDRSAAGGIVNYCSFLGASGISNRNIEVCINAENNWWGDASGPNGGYLSAPNDACGLGPNNGSGVSVSDHVDYVPWLGAPPGPTPTPVPTPTPPPDRYGVFVGINNYGPDLAVDSLYYCLNDATHFRNRLLDDISLWNEYDFTSLFDTQATKTAVRKQLTDLAGEAVSGDTVLYYQASHGNNYSGGTVAWLYTYDGHYWDYDFAADLAHFTDGVDVIVVLDACHSGGMFKKDAEGRPAWNFARNVTAELKGIKRRNGVQGPDVGWLTSCAYDEISYESQKLQYGYFTYYLLQAFRHGDSNSDGKVTFKELFDYAELKVDDELLGQHPQSENDTLLSATIATNTKYQPLRFKMDWDGDGVCDHVIYRPHTGLWAVQGITRFYFGRATGRATGRSNDLPVPGDYNGDGVTDPAIFRSSSGLWAIRGLSRIYFGSSNDKAVPGDYDGDGVCDIGIFRASGGLWAIKGVTRIYFGGSGDGPVPGDYDWSGDVDVGIFRESSGLWAIRGITRVYFGAPGDIPMPEYFAEAGACTEGLFRPSSGLWAIRGVTRVYFGTSDDQPGTADYDGDGSADPTIFRDSSSLWAVRGVTRVYFGGSGDVALFGPPITAPGASGD